MKPTARALWLVLLGSGAARAEAPPSHYTITNSSVRDNATQLIWERSPDQVMRSWAAAKMYCETLGLEAATWRLPTLKELLTIIDPVQTPAPVIDVKAFPSTQANIYWSATEWVANPTHAWTVDFSQGNSAKDHEKTEPGYVRCVR